MVFTAANCRDGLSCTGTACTFDCNGNSGGIIGLQGPGMSCSCTNSTYTCRVLYEGTLGSVPLACAAGTQAGAACPYRCSLCRLTDSATTSLCFCSKDMVWVCQ